MDRRQFVAGALAIGSASCVAPGAAGSRSSAAGFAAAGLTKSGRVNFTRDGLDLSPLEHAELLTRLADQSGIGVDSYSRGGVVEQLEVSFAKALGKERAVFVPTGTLANHLALRRLTRRNGGNKVIVQAESHVFRDSGDCAQALSGLHLVPLAAGQPTFSAEAFEQQIERSNAGRVQTRIGAVSIESAVRRLHNRRFDHDELRRVVSLAQRHGIALHLDGARLFIESAFTGVPVAETAALFDTVYVSLYKAFHSGSGAILAGPAELLQGLYHERRMFGGGLPQAWQYAAVALSFFDGTVDRLHRAIARADDLFAQLGQRRGFSVERLPGGSNVVLLHADEAVAATLQQQALAHGVVLPSPTSSGTFALKVNESLNRAEVERVLAAFPS